MGVQTFKPAKAPEQWVLAESEEDRFDNRNALLGAGGDDPDDDIEYPDDGQPELDPHKANLTVSIAFKCDDTLRDWIDAVGSAHGFSRSEAVRRLVFLGVMRLDGKIARVRADAQAEAA